NTDTVRKEDVYDEQGNVTGTNEYKMSDYDYTKKLLKEKSDALVQAEARRIAQQQKEENSNFGTNLLAILSGASYGVMNFVNNVFSFAEGIYDGFVAVSNGESFDTAFRNAFNTSEDGSADWRIFDNIGWTDDIIEWNIANTDAFDLDGNVQNNIWGMLYQLSNMAGEYSIPLLLTLGLGAVGVSASVASGISQGLYYGYIGVENLKEY